MEQTINVRFIDRKHNNEFITINRLFSFIFYFLTQVKRLNVIIKNYDAVTYTTKHTKRQSIHLRLSFGNVCEQNIHTHTPYTHT